LKIPVISHDDQTLGPEVCVTPNNAYDAWPIATIQIHCNHLDSYIEYEGRRLLATAANVLERQSDLEY